MNGVFPEDDEPDLQALCAICGLPVVNSSGFHLCAACSQPAMPPAEPWGPDSDGE